MSDAPNMVYFRPGKDGVEVVAVIDGKAIVVDEWSPRLAQQKAEQINQYAMEKTGLC